MQPSIPVFLTLLFDYWKLLSALILVQLQLVILAWKTLAGACAIAAMCLRTISGLVHQQRRRSPGRRTNYTSDRTSYSIEDE